MIKSMTGFGRAKYENDGREYCIEIKTINHRYNDIIVKLPRNLSFLEGKLKKVVSNSINRGKVDVSVSFANYSDKCKSIRINNDLAKRYIHELKELKNEHEILDDISIMSIINLPDVISTKNEEDEDLIWSEIEIPLKIAIEECIEMRNKEGAKILKDIVNRLDNIEKILKEISSKSTGLVDEYIVKLNNRIKEILQTDVVDEMRLSQEIVIYADKCSIEEEITRLDSHINQFRELLNQSVPVGKKIDFLIQEMNRETNTIGSKASSLIITNLVIEIKTELEDIREQIQNIE